MTKVCIATYLARVNVAGWYMELMMGLRLTGPSFAEANVVVPPSSAASGGARCQKQEAGGASAPPSGPVFLPTTTAVL